MNFENMELDDLKEYAKTLDIKVGNISKDKLIEKIKKTESEKAVVSAVMNDDDLEAYATSNPTITQEEKKESLLESITSAIDDLDESIDTDQELNIEDLPIDAVIPVKSISFGGLTYKSRTNNAIFRWNQIGAIEYMTVADLNEMNNYKRDFLNRPLVILMDERAIKKFRLKPVYENVAKINNLKQVFASDMATIENTINTALQVNMRDIWYKKVKSAIWIARVYGERRRYFSGQHMWAIFRVHCWA